MVSGERDSDILLVASGATVGESWKAAQALAAQGIRAKVINVVSLNKIQRENSTFVRQYLEDGVPILTAHDAEAHALGHRVMEAVNTARKLGKKPGMVLASLGANVSPLSNHVGSGSSEENYRCNQLDAAGIAAVARQLLKKIAD